MLARGGRENTSKFASVVEPFTLSKVLLVAKEKTMPILAQFEVMSSFMQLKEDLIKFCVASAFFEILLKILPEEVPDRWLFKFILKFLSDASVEAGAFVPYFHRLLIKLGYGVSPFKCGVCGKNKDIYFSTARQIFICRSCLKTNEPALHVPIGKWKSFFKEKSGKISVEDIVVIQSECISFLGFSLKGLEILKSVLRFRPQGV